MFSIISHYRIKNKTIIRYNYTLISLSNTKNTIPSLGKGIEIEQVKLS